MSYLKEVQAIREIFNNFKNLGASYLLEEENLYMQKIDRLVNEIEDKLKAIEMIDEEIEKLEEELSEKDSIELIDIEIIRNKTLMKKLEKKIEKLASLNSNHVKVDANERDKKRFRGNITRLYMIKRLTELKITKDGEVILAGGSGHLKSFTLSQNNLNETNAKILWANMTTSSPYIKEWEALFG